MNNKYSKKVMQHFLHPKNVGEIKSPSGRGRIGNSVCGDIMEMTLKIEIRSPKKLQATSYRPIITDAKFLTFGCGAAVATSSIVTELVKGKTIEEAKKLTPEKVDRSLGNLPVMKKHCARLAINALKKAIEDYESRIKK